MWGGYAAAIGLSALAAFLTPSFDAASQDGFGAISANAAEILAIAVLVIGVPILFVFGVAAPFAALLSLYKSWIAARTQGIESARVATFWMIVSQMGGGVLTILIIPLLRLFAPSGPLATIAAALLFAGSLLMPLAFAAGVWRYGVLELDPSALPR